MQLKEWFAQWVKKALSFFSSAEEEPKDESLLGQCEQLYSRFPYGELASYHQSKGIGINVEALYHNIGKTAEAVNQHLAAMQIHGNPLPEMCKYEAETVRFNKFILTKDERYQPLRDGMLELQEAVLRLCAKIREGEKDEVTHPYTLRLLTPLLRHLIDVLVIVEEVNQR